jgi:hypothetical protein
MRMTPSASLSIHIPGLPGIEFLLTARVLQGAPLLHLARGIENEKSFEPLAIQYVRPTPTTGS